MKGRTVMLGRMLAGALLAALVVAPASGVGGVASQLSSCNPMAPAGAALGRGGPVREPDLGQVHADLPTSAKDTQGRRSRPRSRCIST
jgi:hypothetical protein